MTLETVMVWHNAEEKGDENVMGKSEKVYQN